MASPFPQSADIETILPALHPPTPFPGTGAANPAKLHAKAGIPYGKVHLCDTNSSFPAVMPLRSVGHAGDTTSTFTESAAAALGRSSADVST